MFFRVYDIKPLSIINGHIFDYPSPSNINYFWGFGFLAAFSLLIQIITGICLAMHYTASVKLAFYSVEHIMRDINYGWLLRYLHANCASFFFLVTYIHMARAIYFKSFRSIELWFAGILIFLLMMGSAFMGYVLPWGQMSFWGATVITNLASAVPLVGPSIAIWLWGGFSVGNVSCMVCPGQMLSTVTNFIFLCLYIILLFIFILNLNSFYHYLSVQHSNHLVDSSPWPIMTSFAVLQLTLGFILYFHFFSFGFMFFVTMTNSNISYVIYYG